MLLCPEALHDTGLLHGRSSDSLHLRGLPIRVVGGQWHKGPKAAKGAYSCGHSPGFSPGSLFIRSTPEGSREPLAGVKIEKQMCFARGRGVGFQHG